VGRADDTALSLRVARNRNGLRALTTQESHGFSRVECQRFAYAFEQEISMPTLKYDV
jgi:hypothetical protein